MFEKLQAIEERYDRENAASPRSEQAAPLSSEIEAFLQGLDFEGELEPLPDPDDDPGDE